MIPLFKVWMSPDAPRRVSEVLQSGYIGQGPVVEAFEAALATRLGTPHVLTTSSGTAAIDLALAEIGIGPGDEVITTPMTCVATNLPIYNRGATIVWADIDPVSGLISPASIAERLTPRTRAIVAVDWGGDCIDVAGIRALTSLPILIDSAHRAPSALHARSIPDDAGIFVAHSFQAIKFLTTGDGGCLVVPSSHYKSAKLRRWFGLDRETSADFRCSQAITLAGYKYHMNDIAAAIGLANLEGLDERILRHVEVRGKVLRSSDARGSQTHPWVAFTHVRDRDAAQAHLSRHGAASSLVHSRNDYHPIFRGSRTLLVGLESFSRTYLAVPCGWWMTDADADLVTESLSEWESQHGRPE